MIDFFGVTASGPFFFVSAWALMIFAGIVGSDVGIRPFGYVTSVAVTTGLWLTQARPWAPSRASDAGSPGGRRRTARPA